MGGSERVRLSLVEGLAETVAFAEVIDVDPAQFLDAIAEGPIDNPYAQVFGPFP